MAFWEGLWVGFLMMLFIGPVFFTLLQAAFQYGFKSGLAVALGIIVSDIICVLLCRWGIVEWFLNEKTSFWVGVAGSMILLGMGAFYLWKARPESIEIQLSATDYMGLFMKGFLVNFVNPFVFFVWIGISSRAVARYGEESHYYLMAVLLGIFTTDVLKAFFAHKIKPLLNPQALAYIFKGVGVLLIIFGLVMVARISQWV